MLGNRIYKISILSLILISFLMLMPLCIASNHGSDIFNKGPGGYGGGGGHNCIDCHNITNKSGAPKIDVAIIKNVDSAHKNLNGGDTDINKVCYACHGDGNAPAKGKHPVEYKTPKQCTDCHTGPGKYTAPLIVEHNEVGEDIITLAVCTICHFNTGMHLDSASGNDVHYIKDITDTSTIPYTHSGPINTSNCKECHLGKNAGSVLWGNPPNISTSTKFDHEYTETGDCEMCHSDSSIELSKVDFHNASLSGVDVGACMTCHTSNPTVRFYVDISLFGKHAYLDDTNGGIVTDEDCLACHDSHPPDGNLLMKFGGADSNNTKFCDDCHVDGIGKPNIGGLKHGKADCKWCHIAGDDLTGDLRIQYRYHPGGTNGTAKGLNCFSCHWYANLPDLPFHAPGESHEGPPYGLSECRFCHNKYKVYDYHNVSEDRGEVPPKISNLIVEVYGLNATVKFRLRDDKMQIAAAQYNITDASGAEIIGWTDMSPKDGRYNNYWEDVIATINISSYPSGTYTVNVKGMAAGPKTYSHLPYYPYNGHWCGVSSSQFQR